MKHLWEKQRRLSLCTYISPGRQGERTEQKEGLPGCGGNLRTLAFREAPVPPLEDPRLRDIWLPTGSTVCVNNPVSRELLGCEAASPSRGTLNVAVSTCE